MDIEGIKLVADALADAATGVNSLLAGVERYAGHQVPPNVTVYNEVDDGFVARGLLTADTPIASSSLIVFETDVGEVTGTVHTAEQDGVMAIAIVYPLFKTESVRAIRDARYTLRAVRRRLVILRDDETAFREANNVVLVEIPMIRRTLVEFPHLQIPPQLGVVATLELRDNKPRG